MATWRPGPEDLRRVFDEQNPWHRSGTVPDVLAPPTERPLAGQLWKLLTGGRVERFQLILGPRRVGKTTAMYQTVRHLLGQGTDPRRLCWLRLDHPLLLRQDLGSLVRSVLDDAGTGSPIVLFLDELVYASDWDLWLKTFFDDRWPVRVVATSSATAALRHRRLESGVGRWSEQFLTPYTFTEFLDLIGSGPEIAVGKSLAETIRMLPPRTPDEARVDSLRRRFLLLGGFPELLAGEREQERTRTPDEGTWLLESQQVLRSDAVERAVYKDIPQSFGVVSPMMLERLLYTLAGQVTGILSPTTISKELDGLSQPTFDRYLSYLERAFLVFTLPNYSGNETTIQRRGRKLYFIDGAVRNAALQRGLAPLSNPAEMGMLMENLVAASLHSLALLAGLRLFHWREGRTEVDLILDHPTDPLAFEIASSPDHSREGLRALAERHPRFAGRCYLVAPQVSVLAPEASPTGTGTLPINLLLIACGRQAETALASRLLAPGLSR